MSKCILRLCLTILWTGFSLFATAVHAAPPVPAVPVVPPFEVVAANPVEGVRVLAARQDESFQVFLWRAGRYLDEQFKEESFESARAILEKAGAEQIMEWGEDASSDGPDRHVVRYAVQKDVMKSRVGRAHTCVVELQHFRKADVLTVSVSIVVEFGLDLKTAVARRDYPKGTVLDRVLGLADLKQRARKTPRLDKIEVSYGRILYSSLGDSGYGFMVDVFLEKTPPRHHFIEQEVDYFALSDLDSQKPFSTQEEKDAFIHTPHDSLLGFGDLPEPGYPGTFNYFGGHTSTHQLPKKPQK